MVDAIAVGDLRRRINEAERRGIETEDGWDREKSVGWMGARSWLRAEDARRTIGREGASDGKTVMGSESEDNYNDRGPHKRERSLRVRERGGGNKRVRESGEGRGAGLISPKEKEDGRNDRTRGGRERGARTRE